MLSSWFGILALIGALSSFLPVIFLIIWKEKVVSQKIWLATFLLAISWLLAEVLNFVLASYGMNNIWVFHSYDLISTVLYLWLFSLILKGNRIPRLLMALGVGYFLTSCLLYFVFGSFSSPNTYAMVLTMVIPFLLSIFYFFSIARAPQETKLIDSPIYWINSAILLHFGISLFVNISYEFILKSQELQLNLWPIIIVTNIVHNVLISIAAWKMRQI